jgi:hypothetical protein
LSVEQEENCFDAASMIAKIINGGTEPEIDEEHQYDAACAVLLGMFDKGWLNPGMFSRDFLVILFENKRVTENV